MFFCGLFAQAITYINSTKVSRQDYSSHCLSSLVISKLVSFETCVSVACVWTGAVCGPYDTSSLLTDVRLDCVTYSSVSNVRTAYATAIWPHRTSHDRSKLVLVYRCIDLINRSRSPSTSLTNRPVQRYRSFTDNEHTYRQTPEYQYLLLLFIIKFIGDRSPQLNHRKKTWSNYKETCKRMHTHAQTQHTTRIHILNLKLHQIHSKTPY